MGRAKVWKLTCLALVAAFALACLAGCAKQPASEPTAAPTQAPAQNGGGDDQPTDQPAAAKDPSEFTGSLMYWCGDQNWSEAMDPAFMEVYPNVNVSFTPLGWGDYLQKLQTSMASGLEIPDIICAEVGWRMRVYEMDICENLEVAPYNIDRNDMFGIPLAALRGPRRQYRGSGDGALPGRLGLSQGYRPGRLWRERAEGHGEALQGQGRQL